MTRAERRVRVIVNPGARAGAGQRALRPLRNRPAAGLTVEWQESRSAAHLGDLVAAAQDDDTLDAVAVAGGDGTVALAVSALSETARLPLGILPTGSGNDFARELGLPRNPRAAFRLLRDGVPRRVDLMRASQGNGAGGAGGGGQAASGPVTVVAVASVGFDSLSLPIVHGGLPRSKALNAYAAVQGLLHYVPRPVRVTWQGGSHEGPLVFAAAANTCTYGGGFRIAPAARLDDGLLDICLVRATGPARLLQLFAQVMSGGHGNNPEVILAQSPWVRIEAVGAELPVAMDGDLPSRVTPLELSCRPAALQVLCRPPPAQANTEARDAA